MIININNSTPHNYSHKMQKCLDYIQSLEEERRKIQVFQRELPLCFQLVSEAIEKCKKEFCNREQSECSEQTSTDDGPVLEEFMPIKTASSSEQHQQQEEDEQHSKKSKNNNNHTTDKSSKKSDWLRSVQLWNQTPDLLTNEESPRKVSVVEVNKNGNGGAFHPFKREEKRMLVETPPAAAASSTAETGGSSGGGGCKGGDKEDSQRKARRCWSSELHRRFLQALQQLGGAHVATPKQIRELMKVDGLTNDEVKSHLQKYRLHTRRPSPSVSNNNPQAPQFVVVRGIWVPPPPPEYTSTAAASGDAASMRSSPPSGIYAPKATLAKAFKEEATRKQREESETNYSDKNESYSKTITPDSPSTSSSTHTTTASPAF